MTMSLHTASRRARRALAIAAGTGLLGGSIAYATGVVGEPSPAPRASTSPISLVDNDGGRPLFSLANMSPGDTATSCIAVTNESPVPVDVALHAAPTGTLDGYLGLTVERGTASAPQPGSCAGFSKEAGVWTGTLADFPRPGQAGVADTALGAGATRIYRYTATLRDIGGNAAQGRTSTVSFAFSGTGEPPVPAPTATPAPPADVPILIDTKPGEVCTTYFLEGGQVQRTVRLRKRVNATLAIRQVGKGAAQRLQLSTALKTSTGKTLINKGWANVTYTQNGKKIATTKKRPFRVNVKPSSLKTGTNTLGVLVRDRHGKKTKASFRLDISKALLNNRTVCVFRTGLPAR
jgi:hypothetical protein